MKIAAMVLGIAASALSIIGSMANIGIGHIGSATGRTTLTSLGLWGLLFSFTALAASITAGLVKLPKWSVLLMFLCSFATFICGNYISGMLLFVAAMFGGVANYQGRKKLDWDAAVAAEAARIASQTPPPAASDR